MPSPCPDLPQLQLQPREIGAGLKSFGRLDPLRFAAGGPDLNGSLRRQQQPAQPGTIGLVAGHLAAQGGDAARAFVAGAGQFHHQVWAEGRETTALLRREPQPSVQPQHRSVRAQYGAIGKPEAG